MFRGHAGSTIIDLTIVDKVTALFVNEWHVIDKYTSSNHQRIAFEVATTKEKIFKCA